MNRPALLAASIASVMVATGCASRAMHAEQPVPRVATVDLQRYAGPWFVIASIPLDLEKGAHAPVETYTLNPDGTIATVFQFRKDAFDGMLETKPTVATVVEGSNNAEWRVKLFGPIKGQYVIAHLEPDYSAAIIARDKRDHVWILARASRLSEERMADYRERIASMGYDVGKLHVFPHNGRGPSS